MGGLTQVPKLSDNGKEDSSTQAERGERGAKKGISMGVRQKQKEKTNGEKPPKSCGTEKHQNARKPQINWTAAGRGDRGEKEGREGLAE